VLQLQPGVPPRSSSIRKQLTRGAMATPLATPLPYKALGATWHPPLPLPPRTPLVVPHPGAPWALMLSRFLRRGEMASRQPAGSWAGLAAMVAIAMQALSRCRRWSRIPRCCSPQQV
jgi:hypothetical protein